MPKPAEVACSGREILIRELSGGEVGLQECDGGYLSTTPGTVRFKAKDWKKVKAAVDSFLSEQSKKEA